jgi:hypothetical protein
MPYPNDPAFRSSTIDLLGTIWKKVPPGIVTSRAWGADWLEGSEPFVRAERGESLAHVGVLEIPVVARGRRVTLAGIHAVCTRADHRGRGHMRDVMTRALAWVDARYEAAVLWANDAAIYGRFGFVARSEHVFRTRVETTNGAPRTRRLSLDDADDRRLFRERLARRAPVSQTFGAMDAGWLTMINVALWGADAPAIVLADAIDAIVVYEVQGRVLRLYDVIAAAMPPLDAVVSCLGGGFDAVDVFFAPDGLGVSALEALPTPLDDTFMVRGSIVPEGTGVVLSPLSRC